MKLSPDCVRDILLLIEESAFDEELRLSFICQQLPNYNADEIEYTCLKLYEGNLIHAITARLLQYSSPRIVSVTDMTYNGHEFLENIRSDQVWIQTKTIASNIGSFSIELLGNIASNIISNLLNGYL